MKTPFLLLSALTALTATAAAADDDVIPVSFSKDRYAEMAQKSPFQLATPVEAPKEEKPDPFANIVLRGLGSDYVVIQRHGDDHTIRIYGDKEEDGFKVEKVNWSSVPGESTVDLVNGDVHGTVKFDQNLVRSAAPPPPPAGQNLPPNARRPVAGPQPLNVPPGTNITVPRPPVTSGTPISSIPRPTIPAVQPQQNPANRQNYGAGQNFGRGPGATNSFRNNGTNGTNGGDSSGGRTRIRDLRQINNNGR
jgi:hypothetical protein